MIKYGGILNLPIVLNKLVLMLSLLVIPFQLQAGLVTVDGSQLLANPNVSFPTGLPSLSGSSLQFGPGSSGDSTEPLLRWDLFSLGTINATDPTVSVKVTVNMTRLTNSWAPSIALWDGNQVVGGIFSSTSGGQVLSLTTVNYDGLNVTGYGGAIQGNGGSMFAVDSSGNLSADFELRNNLPANSSTFVNLNGIGFTDIDFTYSQNLALDRTGQISLLILRGAALTEEYNINSITIDSSLMLSSAVPEPTGAMLCLSSIATFAVSVLWRKKSGEASVSPV